MTYLSSLGYGFDRTCGRIQNATDERANAVLGIMNISKGGLSGTVTDVRIVLQAAIKTNASELLFVTTSKRKLKSQ
jgi:hypothetical protein